MPLSLDIPISCDTPGNGHERKAPEETQHHSMEVCSCALTKLCRIFHHCLGLFLLQIYRYFLAQLDGFPE